MAEAGISNKQALVYLAITFGCFAALYPSLFHPLVRGLLNRGKTESDTKNEPPVPVPEQMKRGPQAERRPGRPSTRGGVPPPRSDPAQGATGQTQSSGKGGVMGFVLPVYAVGIVVYLVYVVSKVYTGGGKKAKKLEETDVYENLQKRLSAIDFERVLRGDDRAAMEELTALADQLKQYRQEAGVASPGSDADRQPAARHAASNDDRRRQQRPNNGDVDADASGADVDATADESSLDDLLDRSDQLNGLSSAETQRLQRKLLEAEAKMARIADALRKAGARTEQVLSGGADAAASGQDLASSRDDETAAAAGSPQPDSGVTQIDDDADDAGNDDAGNDDAGNDDAGNDDAGDDDTGDDDAGSDVDDATAQVETLTADLDGGSGEGSSCAQTAAGIRRRAATKSARADSPE